MFSDRRGVSEAIGFVFVFSLVLLTVGTVFTVGYGGLQDTRDAERVNNAERAFDVLANNIEDVTARGAPSRGTEIRLAEASLGTGPATQLNVSVDNGSGQSRWNYSLDPIVYEVDDTQLRYAGGAVSRIQGDGSVLLTEPNFVLSEKRAIVPIVDLSVGDSSIAGSRTVLVRSDSVTSTIVADDDDVDLQINVGSPAAESWRTYLDEGMDCDSVTDDRLDCTTEVDRVQIVHFVIDISFE